MTDQAGAGIGVEGLIVRFDTKAAPLIVDVRRSAALEAPGAVIAGCRRRDPEQVGAWSGTLPAGHVAPHGHEVGPRATDALRAAGRPARFLGTIIRHFQIRGPALEALALIVRGTDTARLVAA